MSEDDSLALKRAEILLGIRSPDANSVEMNSDDDDFPWGKGNLNNQGKQLKLQIRCENRGTSWRLGPHGDSICYLPEYLQFYTQRFIYLVFKVLLSLRASVEMQVLLEGITHADI